MLDTSMVSELQTAITGDIATILPVAIGIFAGLFGIGLLFRLVKKSRSAG